MVVQFVPAHRVVALLESLTGTAPSVGFVHGLLARTAGLLAGVHDRIRTLITLAYAVCCDETPLKVGPRTPRPGKTKAERYLLVACTDLYTHYLLGDRSLDTFKASVLAERAAAEKVVVHDRYQNYDSAEFAGLVHQLCTAHLLRDLDDAAQVYPDAVWPAQISRALRELIHHANLARHAGLDTIDTAVRDTLISRFRQRGEGEHERPAAQRLRQHGDHRHLHGTGCTPAVHLRTRHPGRWWSWIGPRRTGRARGSQRIELADHDQAARGQDDAHRRHWPDATDRIWMAEEQSVAAGSARASRPH